MTSSAQSQDEDQIRRVMAERVTAMHHRDAERFVSHYAPEIVKFDLDPPLQHTAPEATDAEGLRAWFTSKGDGPIGYEIHELSVTAGDNVAFCHSLNQMGSEGLFLLWFRSTVGLRKIDGTWRITHEHNSTPFYMDGSDRAALDLTP